MDFTINLGMTVLFIVCLLLISIIQLAIIRMNRWKSRSLLPRPDTYPRQVSSHIGNRIYDGMYYTLIFNTRGIINERLNRLTSSLENNVLKVGYCIHNDRRNIEERVGRIYCYTAAVKTFRGRFTPT